MSSFREVAESVAESLLYPNIPELGEKAPERKKGPEPFIPHHLGVKLDDPLDEISASDLKKLSIEECYQILEYFQAQKGSITSIIESVRGQISLARNMVRAIEGMKKGNKALDEKLHHVMACEKAFLRDLQSAGLHIQYHSDLEPEEIDEKPALILTTHQGGGGENYIHQALTGIPGRLVVKGSLMEIPYIKDGLQERGAIPVSRDALKDPKKRAQEIKKIAEQIVEEMGRGGNVYIFIEGTRSRDGAIAATNGRQKWAKEILAEIEEQASKVNFQKLLLVVNTMTAMPDAPEEKLLKTRFRAQGTTLSACLMRADHFTDLELENPYDQTTLFGSARAALKDMVIEAILLYQEQLKQ